MSDPTEKWKSSVKAAIEVGGRMAETTQQLDQACGHIVQLLLDASTLLEQGSQATATFLAITALEETSKVSIGMHRRSAQPAKRSEDPLYKHKEKHRLAVGPTVAMGRRLQGAIGEVRMYELIALAGAGGLIPIREASLYLEQKGNSLNIPCEVVPKSLARELLLLAVEAFDDALVGYTSRSFPFSDLTDAIFAKWADT